MKQKNVKWKDVLRNMYVQPDSKGGLHSYGQNFILFLLLLHKNQLNKNQLNTKVAQNQFTYKAINQCFSQLITNTEDKTMILCKK